MSLQEIELLVSLIATGAALLGTIYAFIKKIIKDFKDIKLKKLIEESMIQVENLAITGELKKTKVLEKVCSVFGEGKEIYDKASEYIEECISFSKKINYK